MTKPGIADVLKGGITMSGNLVRWAEANGNAETISAVRNLKAAWERQQAARGYYGQMNIDKLKLLQEKAAKRAAKLALIVAERS